MCEGSQVSKVTLCVEILKWHPLSDRLTKVRYRAAGAAKKAVYFRAVPELANPPSPNSGNLVLFYGRQNNVFVRMTEEKKYRLW